MQGNKIAYLHRKNERLKLVNEIFENIYERFLKLPARLEGVDVDKKTNISQENLEKEAIGVLFSFVVSSLEKKFPSGHSDDQVKQFLETVS